MSALSQFALEQSDHIDNRILELRKYWDDRLDFPPTKITERYLRGGIAVLLKLLFREVADGQVVKIDALLLRPPFGKLHGELCSSGCGEHHEFPVLIDNIHTVKHGQPGAERVGGV